MSSTSKERRAAATAQFKLAERAITAVFDATDELRQALAAIALASTGADPLRAAADVEDAISRLRAGVATLISAANDASPFRTRSELASYANTKAARLFRRAASDRGELTSSTREPLPQHTP